MGNAAGAFIPRGWPTFRFFIKVGTARSAAHSFFAGTSKLPGCPTIALLRTIANPGWLARSVAICFWQCWKKSAGVMASWA
jgi:hypothetical protein